MSGNSTKTNTIQPPVYHCTEEDEEEREEWKDREIGENREDWGIKKVRTCSEF